MLFQKTVPTSFFSLTRRNTFTSNLGTALVLLSLLTFLTSCGSGCVESYDFGSNTVSVEANPTDDGVSGSYSATTGGQVAQWHDTGLVSDGTQIIAEISGRWTSWDQSFWEANQASVDDLPDCDVCAMKTGLTNCICESDETPQNVSSNSSNSCAYDSSNPDDTSYTTNQDDPDICSCTQQHGSATDDDVYYINLDYYNESDQSLTGDEQKVCKFTKGYALYGGLFGSSGFTNPSRVYHLYSLTEVCDVTRDSSGQCLDSDGNDVTKYLYSSPNSTVWQADSDGTYHQAGERLKLIIYDRYYSDNVGYYNVSFLGGVMDAEDVGLLEYIVGLFEDKLLGAKDQSTGKRSGGIVQSLYTTIVTNSTFILMLQTCLVLYIVLFGIGTLAGLIEISRKEMMKRIMKLALVIFFTSPTSWTFYNQFVLGFFKDGMDSIIALIMNLSDSNLSSTSLIKVAQMDRASDVSNATRFSYVDTLIKKLFSTQVTKKIWGLFLGTWFGLLLIPLTYVLIGGFIYVMLLAAFVYITALIKLTFVMSLGPLFIIASLFSKTDPIFKKWLTFLAARSFEIIVLFVVLYLFLILIDSGFTDLLSVRTCVNTWNLWLIHIDVLQTSSTRSLGDWMAIVFETGALILLLRLVMDKIPAVGATMVQISGAGAALSAGAGAERMAVNNSAFGLAKDVTSQLFNIGKFGLTTALPYAARKTYQAAKMAGEVAGGIGRKTGLDKLSAINKVNPVSWLRTWRRNSAIDNVIAQKSAEAQNKGFTGKEANEYIRRETFNALNKESNSSWVKHALTGIDNESISKRLAAKDQNDLKRFIKNKASALKDLPPDQIPVGEKMRDQLRDAARNWAKNNLVDPDQAEGYLANLKNFMRNEGELSTQDAAKAAAMDDDFRNRYFDHLQNLKAEQELERKEFGGGVKTLLKSMTTINAYNPKRTEETVLRKIQYEGKRKATFLSDYDIDLDEYGIHTGKGFNPIARINILDKRRMKDELEQERKKQEEINMQEFVATGYNKERKEIEKRYQNEMRRFAKENSALSKSEIEKHKKDELQILESKYMKAVAGDVLKEAYNIQPQELGPQVAAPIPARNDGDNNAAAPAAAQNDNAAAANVQANQEGKAEAISIINDINSDRDSGSDIRQRLLGQNRTQHLNNINAKITRLQNNIERDKKELEQLKRNPNADPNAVAKLQAEIDFNETRLASSQTMSAILTQEVNNQD